MQWIGCERDVVLRERVRKSAACVDSAGGFPSGRVRVWWYARGARSRLRVRSGDPCVRGRARSRARLRRRLRGERPDASRPFRRVGSVGAPRARRRARRRLSPHVPRARRRAGLRRAWTSRRRGTVPRALRNLPDLPRAACACRGPRGSRMRSVDPTDPCVRSRARFAVATACRKPPPSCRPFRSISSASVCSAAMPRACSIPRRRVRSACGSGRTCCRRRARSTRRVVTSCSSRGRNACSALRCARSASASSMRRASSKMERRGKGRAPSSTGASIPPSSSRRRDTAPCRMGRPI